MRRIAALLTLLTLVGATLASAPTVAASGSGRSIMDAFNNPSASADPMTRSWWPDAGAGESAAGLAMTAQHVSDMAAAGYGGMEIAMLSDQLTRIPQSSTLPADQRLGQPGVDQSMAQTDNRQCCLDFSNAEAQTVGFGTQDWQKVLTQIYQTANSQPSGFVIDLTLSQHWPVAFNNIDPNDVGQMQAARTAYSVITTADVSAGVKTVPHQAQRLWDLDNVPFIFVDHYAAATIMKVASVAANGTPTFSYASLTDVSGQTSEQKNADGSPAGNAAGIMDQAWIDANPSVFTGTLTSGSATISGVSTMDGAQRQAGSILSGPGIPDGTQVLNVSGSTIVMDNAATSSTSGATIDAKWNINTVNADWGPPPSDPNFTGKVDSAGDRTRMADWQYEYQTSISPTTLSNLGCTVPAAGEPLAVGDCVLFGTWYQGTGQTRSGGVNTTQYNREYVVSIYDQAGTQSIIDFWENNILGTWSNGRVTQPMGDTTLINLMKANAARFPQASFFEDSLEFSKQSGSGTYWSSDVLSEMSSQLGYDAARYAPLLATGTSFDSSIASGEQPSNRVNEDWTSTMSDNVATDHVAALQDWAHTNFGYNFRVQDTGGVAVRCCSLATGVHEASADSGAADNGRMVAAAAALTGSNWVSAESLTFTKDYTNPWLDVVTGLNQDWASGINRPQWHGTAYIETFNGANSSWPGWEFQHGSPTGWGAFDPRQIYWGDVQELTDYVARTQAVLQGGVMKVDLAVLRGTNELGAPSSGSNSLQTLMNAGYNYQIIDDRMVQTPNAVVTGGVEQNGVMTGGLLDANGPTNGIADGPAYQAVVVNGVTILQEATVKKLIQYAQAGLPIILFNSTIGRVYGTNQPDNNDTGLAAALGTLTAMPNVYTLGSSTSNATQDQLLSLLGSIGLAPRASYSAAGLETLQREDPGPGATGKEYYYLYNARPLTTLQTAASASDTGMRIGSTSGLQPGDQLIVDSGANQEIVTIASIPFRPPRNGPNVDLTAPLAKAHAAGVTVTSPPIHTLVTLTGSGQPSVLDAWTGTITPIAKYTSGNGTVTVDVTLDPQDTTIIETTKVPGSVHVTDTSGGTAFYANGSKRLMLQATEPGDYTFTLSNGQTRTVEVASVPGAVDLSNGWSLALQSFGPDPASSNPEVSKKTTVDFAANALGNWSDLPATSAQLATLGVTAMDQVSGIGYYSDTFQLPGSWTASDGANLVLDHGNGDEVVAVTVNGTTISTIDQVTDTVDVGPYLHAGTNTLQVKLDTNLGNRVGNRNGVPQAFGLTGVLFEPYHVAAIEGH